MKNKVKNTIAEALEAVKDGDQILVGGFGLVGQPLSIVEGLIAKDIKELTIISNNFGYAGRGLGKLLNQGKIKKVRGSFYTSNKDVGEAYLREEIEIELIPQGTLAEAIRAGGAGIGGFYTKTGAGTDIAQGKEEREINGEKYIFQEPITADVAIIRAHKADKLGNLVYYRSARNFNPDMATAADYVIAEVDEIVEVGELDPDNIHTSHLFVNAIVKATHVLEADKDGEKVRELKK